MAGIDSAGWVLALGFFSVFTAVLGGIMSGPWLVRALFISIGVVGIVCCLGLYFSMRSEEARTRAAAVTEKADRDDRDRRQEERFAALSARYESTADLVEYARPILEAHARELVPNLPPPGITITPPPAQVAIGAKDPTVQVGGHVELKGEAVGRAYATAMPSIYTPSLTIREDATRLGVEVSNLVTQAEEQSLNDDEVMRRFRPNLQPRVRYVARLVKEHLGISALEPLNEQAGSLDSVREIAAWLLLVAPRLPDTPQDKKD